MYLYLNPDHTYARTQAEASKSARKVDVPTDARGLVAYLNELQLEAHKGTAQPVQANPAPETLTVPHYVLKARQDGSLGTDYANAVGQTDVIMRDPTGKEPDVVLQPIPTMPNRGAFKLRQGDEADQFSEWVLEAPGFAVVSVHAACIERFTRDAARFQA